MLKVAGEWVSPAEVEAVLVEHPDVLEVAVVGESVDGLTWPVAYVVAKPGRTIEEAEVVEFCRGRLAGFKRPRRVLVIDDLPKTVTGKIQRARVRELAASTQPTTV
jgi:benzoate-CoA ligase